MRVAIENLKSKDDEIRALQKATDDLRTKLMAKSSGNHEAEVGMLKKRSELDKQEIDNLKKQLLDQKSQIDTFKLRLSQQVNAGMQDFSRSASIRKEESLAKELKLKSLEVVG